MTDTYDDTTHDEIIEVDEAIDETEPVDNDETAVEQPEDQRDDTDTGNKEAARYRRRLRDAEAQRDQLADQLASLQRTEAERLARRAGIKADALWASGVELADLVDDAGGIDEKKVDSAIDSVRQRFGLPDPKRNNVVPNEGRTPTNTGRDDWTAAFSR